MTTSASWRLGSPRSSRTSPSRHSRSATTSTLRTGSSLIALPARCSHSGGVPRRASAMRFSINIPNFGEFANPRTVATVAAAAEEAGWDGRFVWDHVVNETSKRRGQPFGEPWMLLTAAALATSRLRLGTMVTPVARRRPEQLARQVATLDSLSDGRVIFCAGLGGPIEDEYGSFGDTTDPIVLAERLDEGLDLMSRYWSG